MMVSNGGPGWGRGRWDHWNSGGRGRGFDRRNFQGRGAHDRNAFNSVGRSSGEQAVASGSNAISVGSGNAEDVRGPPMQNSRNATQNPTPNTNSNAPAKDAMTMEVEDFPVDVFAQDVDETVEEEQRRKKVKVRKRIGEHTKVKLADIACGVGKQKFSVRDALFDIPINISFGQLLQVSPTVRRELRAGIALNRRKKPKDGEEVHMEVDQPARSAPRDIMGVSDVVEDRAIRITASVDDQNVYGVIIDPGTMVNLISPDTVKRLNLKISAPSRAIVRMADGGRRPLLGIVRAYVTVAGRKKKIVLHVIEVDRPTQHYWGSHGCAFTRWYQTGVRTCTTCGIALGNSFLFSAAQFPLHPRQAIWTGCKLNLNKQIMTVTAMSQF